ncbi:TPA: hypothetical protein DDZ86_05290 [Candidatus Dependentiae bacterium]|nr:hypothetical protein [Candidatus Dependentiae bacterium]
MLSYNHTRARLCALSILCGITIQNSIHCEGPVKLQVPQKTAFFNRLSTRVGTRLSYLAKLPFQSKRNAIITGLIATPTILGLAAWTAWRIHPLFYKKTLSEKHAGLVKKVVKVLGYNPDFKSYDFNDNQAGYLRTKLGQSPNATVILTSHGWGGENLADGVRRNGEFISLGGNFRDATQDFPLNLRFANLGQAPDASVLLYQLVKCQKLGVKKIVGFGHSRGGGAYITLLYMLTFPEKYKSYFKTMGLTQGDGRLNLNEINNLKNLISRVILLHPLVNLRSVLKNGLGRIGVGVEAVLPLIGNYNLFEKTQLDMLKEMYSNPEFAKTLPTLQIFLSDHDEVVGTTHNQELKDFAKTTKRHKGGKGKICVAIDNDSILAEDASRHNNFTDAQTYLGNLSV